MNITGELKAKANWKKHLGKRLRKRKAADRTARKTRAAQRRRGR